MTPFSPPPARERVMSGDLHRRELVGLHARIVSSCNPEIVGAAGRVVGETRNMLAMQARRPAGRRGAAAARARLYPKAGSVWRFCAPGDASSSSAASAELDGSSIARRPEDRLRSRAPPAAAPAATAPAGGGGTGRTGGGAA